MNESQDKIFQLFKKAEKRITDSLVPILLIYFLVSVLYQASSFWLDNTLYSKVEKISNRCFELRLRLPNQIPLSSPNGDNNGKPITVWGWKTSNPYCPDQELTVNLSDQGDLIFTDSGKTETASSFLVKLGGNEANAARYTAFVFSPLARDEINFVEITANVFGKNNLSPVTYPRSVQSPKTYSVFRVLEICLGTTMFSVVAFVFSAIKYAIDQREKVKEENKSFESKLAELTMQKTELASVVNRLYENAERLHRTNELMDKFERIKKDLEHGSIWSLSIRKEIAFKLGMTDFETYLQKISENLKYPFQAEVNELIAFSNLIGGDTKKQDQFAQRELGISLRVFQLLGFNSKEVVINYLNGQKDKIQTADWLHDWYDKVGGATGRYLLRQIDAPDLQRKLNDDWERNNPSPPNRITPPYGLWSQKMRFVASGGKAKDLPEPRDWRHPFGPIKAEDDPRLPRGESKTDDRPVKALFWENKPTWDKVSSAEPACFYMSPGMGMSALILMGRHERRFWGTKPSLSLYIPLHGKPEKEIFNNSFEKAFGESVLLSAVEDPFWLLDAPEGIQEKVGAFLLLWAGNDLNRLLRTLASTGLPENEQLLVADMLYKASQAQPYRSSSLKDLIHIVVTQMGRTAFIRTLDVEPFKMYIWTELKDDIHVHEWLDLFAAEGLAGIGVLKIFIHKIIIEGDKKNQQKVTEENLSAKKIGVDVLIINEWTEKELTDLLEYRMGKVWSKEGKTNLLEGIMTRDLVEEAKGSPQRLIQLGNEKLFGTKQG